jgi:hypothetical protein
MTKLAHVPVQTWKSWDPNNLFGGWFSAIGGFRTLVRAVGLSLGVCIIFAASFPWLYDLLGPLERLLEKEKCLHI